MKGDAVAGLLITALNLVAGIGFGLSVHQLSFSEALSNYSILTVGDGLVSQIPAIIVSVSAALLLSKGRDEGAIDRALTDQMAANKTALMIVAGILFVFALFPGLPFLPFMMVSIGLAAASFMLQEKERGATDATQSDDETTEKPEPQIGDSIHADEIHLEVSPDLVGVVLQGEQGIETRIDKMRRYIAEEYGFVLPPIRMTDNPSVEKNHYRLKVQGVRVDQGFVRPGSVLALMEELETVVGRRAGLGQSLGKRASGLAFGMFGNG